MEIIDTNLNFKPLTKRTQTNKIILHHSASETASPEDIHRWHLNNGWSGAGYHFLVRKDGKIYRLRPEDTVGAHASGSNSDSIGICAEGNYDYETMPEAQKKSLIWLVNYLKNKYHITKVIGHRDVNNTSCPGKNYPFNEIVNGKPSEDINPAPSKPSESSYSYKQFVKDIQIAEGQTGKWIDGIAGNRTLELTPTISRYKNDRNACVKPVQKYLYYLGYKDVGRADGIAGVKFDTAVKQFQRDNGCVVDGELTSKKKTWKKLLKIN